MGLFRPLRPRVENLLTYACEIHPTSYTENAKTVVSYIEFRLGTRIYFRFVRGFGAYQGARYGAFSPSGFRA